MILQKRRRAGEARGGQRAGALLGAAGGALVAGLGALGVLNRRGQAEAGRVWRQLEQAPPGPVETFREEMVAGLPEPARRYLLHAIRPGARLARTVVLEMGGVMRLQPDGPWLPLRARELLASPRGFVWRASVGQRPLRFSGADLYADGVGQMRFSLWGLLPVARGGGPDVARSARGRLAGETIWNPAALLPGPGVAWEAVDERTARVTLPIDGEPIPLTLTVESDGRLRSAVLPRWGDQTEDRHHALIPFGVEVLEECTFDGYTIPARLGGGWWYDTERYFESFRPVIERAEFS